MARSTAQRKTVRTALPPIGFILSTAKTYWPNCCERALRSGVPEISIRSSQGGQSGSRIRNITPETDSAQTSLGAKIHYASFPY